LTSNRIALEKLGESGYYYGCFGMRMNEKKNKMIRDSNDKRDFLREFCGSVANKPRP
jgi:hypothetical protein